MTIAEVPKPFYSVLSALHTKPQLRPEELWSKPPGFQVLLYQHRLCIPLPWGLQASLGGNRPWVAGTLQRGHSHLVP